MLWGLYIPPSIVHFFQTLPSRISFFRWTTIEWLIAWTMGNMSFLIFVTIWEAHALNQTKNWYIAHPKQRRSVVHNAGRWCTTYLCCSYVQRRSHKPSHDKDVIQVWKDCDKHCLWASIVRTAHIAFYMCWQVWNDSDKDSDARSIFPLVTMC